MTWHPKAGMVIEFPYMWQVEAEDGDDNPKKRPCVVMAAVQTPSGLRISVVPVSHTVQFEAHVEVPKNFLHQAGLDGQHSYVITEEMNVFDWPPKSADLSVRTVGVVPEGFFNRLQTEIARLRAQGYVDEVDRDALAQEVIASYRARGG